MVKLSADQVDERQKGESPFGVSIGDAQKMSDMSEETLDQIVVSVDGDRNVVESADWIEAG